MKKKLVILLGIILVVVLFIGGKKYMDKKAVEKDYQQGMKLIQTYVTEYLIDNYEGIEKIEWQGVGVEWRNSPVFGSSMFGNYVNSYVNVYISEETYFTMEFRLHDKAEYDYDKKKYIALDSLNPSNIDSTLEMELRNTTRKLNGEEKIEFEKIRKADMGSKQAKTIYNLEIHELIY
ncbi:hypothetical protein [uncultured Enterococcus sp.]|uniref:hypothetical protein n=1 Tax=uncultured Enterococcus sp. TaxID=167972 RepID=UPI002AA6D00B|nr:hypothetical protein [uncultured Enterococcus sp.]